MKANSTQLKRIPFEPLGHCLSFPTNCTYPVCHCYDHDQITKEDADKILLHECEQMLSRLRIFIDDLNDILRNGKHWHSYEQMRVYRKRKTRLQKNFNFWKKRYDQIRYNKRD